MTFQAASCEWTPDADQACAVPFREQVDRIEYCLITSSRGRWKFPKGFVEPGETVDEAALKEAYEEAGLHGRVVGDPIGSYKIFKKGRTRTVMAMLMEVSRSDAAWQEDGERERRWVTADEAHALFSEPELHDLLKAARAMLPDGQR